MEDLELKANHPTFVCHEYEGRAERSLPRPNPAPGHVKVGKDMESSRLRIEGRFLGHHRIAYNLLNILCQSWPELNILKLS